MIKVLFGSTIEALFGTMIKALFYLFESETFLAF